MLHKSLLPLVCFSPSLPYRRDVGRWEQDGAAGPANQCGGRPRGGGGEFGSAKGTASPSVSSSSTAPPPPLSHNVVATSGSTYYFPPNRFEGKPKPKIGDPNVVVIRCSGRAVPVDVSVPPLTAEEVERWKLDRLIVNRPQQFDIDREPKFLFPPQEKLYSLGPEMDRIDALFRRKGRYTPSEVAHAFFPVIPSYFIELRHVFSALPPSIAYRMEQDMGQRGMGANFFSGYPMLFLQRRPTHQKSAIKLNSEFWFVRAHPFYKKADKFQYKNNSDYKAAIGGVVHKFAPTGDESAVGGGLNAIPGAGNNSNAARGKDIDVHIFDILARHIRGTTSTSSNHSPNNNNNNNNNNSGDIDDSSSSSSSATPCSPGTRHRTPSSPVSQAALDAENSLYQPVPLVQWMNSLRREDMSVVQQVPEQRVLLILSKYVRVFQLLCAHGEDPLLYTDRSNLMRHGRPAQGRAQSPSSTAPGTVQSENADDEALGNRASDGASAELDEWNDEDNYSDVDLDESTAAPGLGVKTVGDASTNTNKSGAGIPLNEPATSAETPVAVAAGAAAEGVEFACGEGQSTSSFSAFPSALDAGEEGKEGNEDSIDSLSTKSTSTATRTKSSGAGHTPQVLHQLDEDLLGLDDILSGSAATNSTTRMDGLVEEENARQPEEDGGRNDREVEVEESDNACDGPSSPTTGVSPHSSPSSSRHHQHGQAAGGLAAPVDEDGGFSLGLPTRLDILLVRRLPPSLAPRCLSNFNAETTPLPEITLLAASFLGPPPSLRNHLNNYFTMARIKHQRHTGSLEGDIWRWTPINDLYEVLTKEQRRQLRPYRGLTNYLRLHGELFEVSSDLMNVIAHDPKGVVSPFLPQQKIFSFEERVVLPAGGDQKGLDSGAALIGEKERKLFRDILGVSQIPTTRKQIALLDPENPILNSEVFYEEIARLLPPHPVRKREVLSRLPPILRAAVPTRGLFNNNCSRHIAVFFDKGEAMVQRKADFKEDANTLKPGAPPPMSAEAAIEEVRQHMPDGGATVKALRRMYIPSPAISALIQHFGSIIHGLEAFPQYFVVERREGMPASDSFVRLR